MGRRPPSQLRGSTGISPASRTPGAGKELRPKSFAVNPLQLADPIRSGSGGGVVSNPSMGKITLITGGARSGKSAHALELADHYREARRYFVATAEALDDEMTARIERHRADRDADFTTVEEPVNLASALEGLNARADLVVLDCLTLWVSNLMRVYSAGSEESFIADADALAGVMLTAPFATLVITDEVGSAIVPDNPLARRFRDLLGWTNQTIAKVATEVILMVAGYPVRVK
jgi:adenosylcobinamide kinase/adenosylcobinamide-phosphate guanylyltransferase